MPATRSAKPASKKSPRAPATVAAREKKPAATPMAISGKWLIKSEPDVYSFARLVKEGATRWDGVRNYTARNFLRAMKVGDLAFFYHSNEGKQIVGLARVKTAAYADPTAEEGDWSAVDFEPVMPLVSPVTLATIKATPALAKMQIITLSRLSVTAVTDAEWKLLFQMAKTSEPDPKASRARQGSSQGSTTSSKRP